MLSKELLRIICKAIVRFTFLQILPVSWDATKNLLEVKCKFVEKLQFYIRATAQTIIFLPVIVLGPRICMENSNNIAEIVMPVIELLGIFNAILFQATFYFYRYEIVNFINVFLKFEASQRKFVLESFCTLKPRTHDKLGSIENGLKVYALQKVTN